MGTIFYNWVFDFLNSYRYTLLTLSLYPDICCLRNNKSRLTYLSQCFIDSFITLAKISEIIHSSGATSPECLMVDPCKCLLQYIPRNMHPVFALLCFVVVIHWLIFPYPSGLLHWHCGNLTIAPVPAKQPWWIWINTSCEFIMNDCITTTKQCTTKPCAYFLGYTVSLGWKHMLQMSCPQITLEYISLNSTLDMWLNYFVAEWYMNIHVVTHIYVFLRSLQNDT